MQLFSSEMYSEQTLEIEKQIEEICAQQEQLRKQLRERMEARDKSRGHVFTKCVSLMTPENTIVCRLSRQTSTTELLDSFHNSKDKCFLVFKHCFSINLDRWISLITAKVYPSAQHMPLRTTMSELKQCVPKKRGYFTWPIHYRNCTTPRLQDICKEIAKIVDAFGDDAEGVFSFELPCRIAGQVPRDRYGFGSDIFTSSEQLYGDSTGDLSALGIIIADKFVSAGWK